MFQWTEPQLFVHWYESINTLAWYFDVQHHYVDYTVKALQWIPASITLHGDQLWLCGTSVGRWVQAGGRHLFAAERNWAVWTFFFFTSFSAVSAVCGNFYMYWLWLCFSTLQLSACVQSFYEGDFVLYLHLFYLRIQLWTQRLEEKIGEFLLVAVGRWWLVEWRWWDGDWRELREMSWWDDWIDGVSRSKESNVNVKKVQTGFIQEHKTSLESAWQDAEEYINMPEEDNLSPRLDSCLLCNKCMYYKHT